MEDKFKNNSSLMIIIFLLLIIYPTNFIKEFYKIFPDWFTVNAILDIIEYSIPIIFALHWIKSSGYTFESIGLTFNIQWKYEILFVVPLITLCLGLVHLPFYFFHDFFFPISLKDANPKTYYYLYPEENTKFIEPVWLIAILNTITNIISVLYEEIIIRGIFITMLKKLGKNIIFIILISASIFATYHLYQGWGNALKCLFLGIVYGLFFIWRKNLFACILLHFLNNFSCTIMSIIRFYNINIFN